MTTNGQQPAAISLRTVFRAAIHDGPGLTFATASFMEPGTSAAFHPNPTVGEPIDGDYLWYRLVDGRGWIHRSLLRPL
jgi:hypothetical protein